MPEVARFRFARAPQRRTPDVVDVVELAPSELVDGWLAEEDPSGQLAGFLAGVGNRRPRNSAHVARG